MGADNQVISHSHVSVFILLDKRDKQVMLEFAGHHHHYGDCTQLTVVGFHKWLVFLHHPCNILKQQCEGTGKLHIFVTI